MKKLYRSRSTKLLGGVAAGTAEYFGADVTLMRLMFALVGLVLPQVILAYLLAWIIIPEEPAGFSSPRREPETRPEPPVAEPFETGKGLTADQILQSAGEQAQGDPKQYSPDYAGSPQNRSEEKRSGNGDRNKQLFGYVLIIVGALVLTRKMVPSFWWRIPKHLINEWWPLGVILVGVAMILGVIKGGKGN